MFNIALISACHDRLNLTKKSLTSITKAFKNTKNINKFHFFILADNCTDGTNKFLNNFENTSILKSGTDLYWARGILRCFDNFYTEIIKYDILIIFNDDIYLPDDNVFDLIEEYKNFIKHEKLFLMSVPCKYNNIITYGGSKFKINSLIPRFKLVEPIKNRISKVDVINMNFALIPMDVIKTYKFLDNYYTHSLADYAYSLKLKKYGINSYLYDKAIIQCKPNLKRRLKLKGINFQPQKKFLKEYFKIFFYCKLIYVFLIKFLLQGFIRR